MKELLKELHEVLEKHNARILRVGETFCVYILNHNGLIVKWRYFRSSEEFQDEIENPGKYSVQEEN